MKRTSDSGYWCRSFAFSYFALEPLMNESCYAEMEKHPSDDGKTSPNMPVLREVLLENPVQ